MRAIIESILYTFTMLWMIPFIVTMILGIYLKFLDKKKEFHFKMFHVFAIGFTPIINITVVFTLLENIKSIRQSIDLDKSKVQKITNLEELPIKLTPEMIDSIDKIIVMMTLSDDYRVKGIFRDDWPRNNGKKIKFVEYTFDNKGAKGKDYLTLTFNNRTGELESCDYISSDIHIITPYLEEAIMMIERRIF